MTSLPRLTLFFGAAFFLFLKSSACLADGEPIVHKNAFQRMSDYYVEEKYDEALTASGQALEENPRSYEVHNMLAHIHWRREEWDQVLESAEKALAIKAGDKDILALIGRACFMKKEYSRAAKALEDAFVAAREANSQNPELCFDLVAVYLELKNYDRAIEWAQKSVSIDPNFANTHYILGRAYLEAGKPVKAIPAFLKALELKKTLTVVREYLGLAYMKTGDRAKARQVFEEILKADPDNKTSKKNLALLETGKENFSSSK